ncbi:MAG: cupin domain-containing protein [Lentisphaerae bacterium]|nr:cupin domain-containing protein [Lentisphaerota bacterium]
MSTIKVERGPSEKRLTDLGARDWPIWTGEASKFPWSYDEPETCYFLEGDVEVTPDGGTPVHIGKGDLAVFPAGMSCAWNIRKAVRKHYRFG